MSSSLINELYLERLTLVVNVAVCLIFVLFIRIFTSKYSYNKGKLSLFSFLYGLNVKQQAILGILLSRLIFVLVSLILATDVNIGHLLVLIIQSIVIFILNRDFKGFIYSIISSLLLVVALFFEGQLFNYYLNSSRELYILILYMGLGLFVTFFAILDFIEGYYRILTGNDFSLKVKKKQELQDVSEN